MPATPRTARTRWIDAGLRALAAGGPEAVRVESLAASLGVTKGGFYWHFAGRQALLAEMLDAWEHTLIDDVIAKVEATDGDARERLRALFALGTQVGGLLEVELAIRDWSRRDPIVAERVRRVDNRRMDYMRSLFGALIADPDEVETRCLFAFALFIGNHFIAADHDDRTRADVLEHALRWLEP